MPSAVPDVGQPARSSAWKWWVCALLLLATMVNYMDRQTLSLTAVRLQRDLRLDDQNYGRVESAFAVAFALGSLVSGWMVDRWNVHWVYAAAVLVWSAAGFATGFVSGYLGLVLCRALLGFAESANWPCALRTTQRILPPAQRTLGNGILQSGAAFGAIITPLIVLLLVTRFDTWRYPFIVVGAVGVTWVRLWLAVVRPSDLALTHRQVPTGAQSEDLRDEAPLRILCSRRFAVLVILAITINTTWHFFRAWLPLFLQKQHGYSEQAMSWFVSAYYLSTDAGSLGAGFVTLALIGWGFSVHASRVLVFVFCALITCLSVAAALLPTGPLLLVVILAIGFGALGLFPNYYAFTQELTVRHQGKVNGTLGCINWLAMSLLHELVGDASVATGSYSLGLALAGLAPLVGVMALLLFWRKNSSVPLDQSVFTKTVRAVKMC
jgi:ACS family hexuronate transporter-like MFS transporter